MASPDPWIVRHGMATPPPVRIPLRAGALRLIYEDGELRYLRLGGRELIRRIYAMVRDAAWNTYPGRITVLAQDVREDAFDITVSAEHRGMIEGGGEVQYLSRLQLRGSADGTIRMRMQGQAMTAFASNRIGLCLLHPTPQVLGAAVTVEHVDGSQQHASFPREISQGLPFTDIRTVSHEAAAGLQVRVRCEGAVFEMEDQRNYGDASFKTFSTPLRMPKPVSIAVGATCDQEVSVSVVGVSAIVPEPAEHVTVAIGRRTRRRLPWVGYGHDGTALTPAQLLLARALGPGFIHVELQLAESGWQQALAGAAAQAARLSWPLEVCVLIAGNGDTQTRLQELTAEIRRWSGLSAIVAVVICSPKCFPPPELLQLARRILTPSCPGAQLVAGSWSGYCLMNERRPDFASLDGVAFECNPQGHAQDSTTVMENLGALSDSVASLRALCAGAQAIISPLRFLPRPTEAANNPRREHDPRLSALFGAAFSCGALAGLLREPPDRISVFTLLGRSGLLATAGDVQDGIQSFPLYHVFADLSEVVTGHAHDITIDQPLRVAAWAVDAAGRVRTQIANLSGATTAVTVQGLGGALRIRTLDEVTARAATAAPGEWRQGWHDHAPVAGPLSLVLKPYAVCLIDALASDPGPAQAP